VRFADGTVDYVLALLVDITEGKRTVEDLQLTQSCIDRLAMGVFRIKEDGSIRYANARACESLGYGRDEFRGHDGFRYRPHHSPGTMA